MKNYLLIVFVFLLIISSLYSISDLYKGSFTVQVGQSPYVQVGQPPVVNVVNGTTSSSSGGSSTGSNYPLSNGIVVNFNTTGTKFINLSNGNAIPIIPSSNSKINDNNPAPIIGSVIDSLISATGLSIMGIAVLIMGIAIILVLKRRNISVNHK